MEVLATTKEISIEMTEICEKFGIPYNEDMEVEIDESNDLRIWIEEIHAETPQPKPQPKPKKGKKKVVKCVIDYPDLIMRKGKKKAKK